MVRHLVLGPRPASICIPTALSKSPSQPCVGTSSTPSAPACGRSPSQPCIGTSSTPSAPLCGSGRRIVQSGGLSMASSPPPVAGRGGVCAIGACSCARPQMPPAADESDDRAHVDYTDKSAAAPADMDAEAAEDTLQSPRCSGGRLMAGCLRLVARFERASTLASVLRAWMGAVEAGRQRRRDALFDALGGQLQAANRRRAQLDIAFQEEPLRWALALWWGDVIGRRRAASAQGSVSDAPSALSAMPEPGSTPAMSTTLSAKPIEELRPYICQWRLAAATWSIRHHGIGSTSVAAWTFERRVKDLAALNVWRTLLVWQQASTSSRTCRNSTAMAANSGCLRPGPIAIQSSISASCLYSPSGSTAWRPQRAATPVGSCSRPLSPSTAPSTVKASPAMTTNGPTRSIPWDRHPALPRPPPGSPPPVGPAPVATDGADAVFVGSPTRVCPAINPVPAVVDGNASFVGSPPRVARVPNASAVAVGDAAAGLAEWHPRVTAAASPPVATSDSSAVGFTGSSARVSSAPSLAPTSDGVGASHVLVRMASVYGPSPMRPVSPVRPGSAQHQPSTPAESSPPRWVDMRRIDDTSVVGPAAYGAIDRRSGCNSGVRYGAVNGADGLLAPPAHPPVGQPLRIHTTGPVEHRRKRSSGFGIGVGSVVAVAAAA